VQESSTKERVSDVVDTAREKTADQAGQVVERGRGMMREQLDERTTQIGNQVGSASETLRQVADQARTQGNHQQARLAEQAADRSERISSYLIEADGDTIIDEIEELARRQPWLVAGAGILIGFAIARALKTSSGQRYEDRYGWSGDYRPRTVRDSAPTWDDQRSYASDPGPAVVTSPGMGIGEEPDTL
jgi:ElaB/YqjD/DUF883 family membrane-anchored ribosome-binding protein